MRSRRHHNNSGDHQVRAGRTPGQVERMAERLRLRFRVGSVIRDYEAGAISKYQPGGDAYIDECAPGAREEVDNFMTTLTRLQHSEAA